MERLVKGDVIVIDFPFSNLKISKRRPVLIIKVPQGEDILVAQITSDSYEKDLEIKISDADFESGSLKRQSVIRIDKIASIEQSLIKYKIGALKKEKFHQIIDKICSYLKE